MNTAEAKPEPASEPVKTCRMVKVVTDVKVTCDPPSHLTRSAYGTRADGTFGHLRYGTPEYWKVIKEKLQGWVRDFDDFIRDHRSQDPIALDVIEDRMESCSACGSEWEIDDGHEDGVCRCASCGAVVEAPAIAKAGGGA